MVKPTPTPIILTYKLLRGKALKYSTRTNFGSSSFEVYTIATNLEILDDIRQHTKVNHYNSMRTDELLRDEALTYKTKREFLNGSCVTYIAAIKRGILDDICNICKFLPRYI